MLNCSRVARVHASGFGSISKWRVKSNISHPLMGVLYLRIDSDTMTLDRSFASLAMVYNNYLVSLVVVVLRQGRQRMDMTTL